MPREGDPFDEDACLFRSMCYTERKADNFYPGKREDIMKTWGFGYWW